MKIVAAFVMLTTFLVACSPSEEQVKSENKIETETSVETDKKDLIDIKANTYTEYYPGRKQIKFQGTQDDSGLRHGKWSFFNENGIEISTTMYAHGKKHGHSVVKFENGAVFYVGEYNQDEQVGIWKTYNPDGSLNSEKNFGEGGVN